MKSANPESAVVVAASNEVAAPAPNVAAMLDAVIKGGVSNENVAALEKLVGLYERMQDRDAEKAFATSFMELQQEIKKVKATKIIPGKQEGSIRSTFAPFEEIDDQARPLCSKHGFTYSFAEGEFNQGRITKICILQHIGGHKRSNPFSVRIGSGPPGCSEAQADGAAHTYAKRGALCDALNIVVTGMDNDAKLDGNLKEKVTKQIADDLEHRVKMTNSDVAAFLKFAGADKFSNIPVSKYDSLDAMLKRKEQNGR